MMELKNGIPTLKISRKEIAIIYNFFDIINKEYFDDMEWDEISNLVADLYCSDFAPSNLQEWKDFLNFEITNED